MIFSDNGDVVGSHVSPLRKNAIPQKHLPIKKALESNKKMLKIWVFIDKNTRKLLLTLYLMFY